MQELNSDINDVIGKIGHYLYLCKRVLICLVSFAAFFPFVIVLSIAFNKQGLSFSIPFFVFLVVWALVQLRFVVRGYCFLKGILKIPFNKEFPLIFLHLKTMQQYSKYQIFVLGSLILAPMYIFVFFMFHYQYQILRKLYNLHNSEDGKGYDIENLLTDDMNKHK